MSVVVSHLRVHQNPKKVKFFSETATPFSGVAVFLCLTHSVSLTYINLV